ncbi:glycosyltransferase family 4 protein [Candidatus Sumerlaeota bacterium]|nr:glycosyltransferase family 4 protein [Candidatus Sumerlaeota bacterium]
MRILHINSESGYRGGERQLHLLAKGLRGRGHEQLIVCRPGSDLERALCDDDFATATYAKPALLGARSPFLKSRLREIAAQFRPGIIHAHTGNAHTMAVGAFLGEYPVVTTRRVDFSVGGGKYTANGQHFIAISRGVRDVLIQGGVPPSRIDIVHSGVETERVRGGDGKALRAEWLRDDGGPLVGFVGALVDHKAPWILAEAAPLIRMQLPGARVVFVGEGAERPRLESLRVKHDEAIILAGHRADVADCYAAFDLFVMPSKLEGLCTSLIDALAAGVPCVASRAGGIPDVVEDGVTGVLVPPLDAGALARAVVDLWNDPVRRKQFVDNGTARVEAQFTVRAMVDGTENVYARMVGA